MIFVIFTFNFLCYAVYISLQSYYFYMYNANYLKSIFP